MNLDEVGISIQMQVEDFSVIDLMTKVRESESSQEIELRETNVMSPDSMAHEDGRSEALSSQSAWKCYWKRCMFLVMLVICSAVLGFEINAQSASIIITDGDYTDPGDFNFLVFCPLSFYRYKNTPVSKNPNEQLRRRVLYDSYSESIVVDPKQASNYDPNRTYQVQAQSLNYTHEVNGKNITETKLFYCGLVREFDKDCMSSFMACSTPGPMFDIPARESVDIIWSNKLDPNTVPDKSNSCMDPNYQAPYPSFCELMTKLNRTQTYLDPTGTTTDTPMKHTRISNTSWPITMHVHGAEIRPTFDGNPLSWTDNGDYSTGKVGVGTFSVNQQCYYDSFDKIDEEENFYNPPKIDVKDQKTSIIRGNFKMNRYPNLQNPGNLWYHDHAMRLTQYNVKYGLAGFYILRDIEVEQQIGVDRTNEKLVMVSGLDLTTSFPLQGFDTEVVYRFRFLNNNFGGGSGVGVVRISFSYGDCIDDLQARETFSIIGADSSLFDQSIDHQKSFVITNAERMEILIIFRKGQNSFAICGDGNNTDIPFQIDQSHSGHSKMSSSSTVKFSGAESTYNIKGIKLRPKSEVTPTKNTRTTIDNVTLSVAYTNLSTRTDIAVSRMRPLIWVGRKTFTIHGRTDFHHGKSEDPTLGTIEDWYIINTISFGHPIHVHLINFQVVAEFDLRVFTSSQNSSVKCTLYEMDFVLDALAAAPTDSATQDYKTNSFKNGVDRTKGVNYEYFCFNLLKIQGVQAVKDKLSEIHPEDVKDDKNISGQDIRTQLSQQDQEDLNGANLTPTIAGFQSQKYVTDNGHPSSKPYYSRWKDTAYVDGYKVLQYRIRWTKSNYTQEDEEEGTYFHVPNDQLREFPGFVYHCHILAHQDNEMMRPIMLQLPENASLDLNTPCNKDKDGNPVLNWSDKYACVNRQCGNQKL